jgi:UDP-N-acetylglucosamine 2-epimerase (non-hydrolysing)
MAKLRVCCVFGTRPEAIKMAPVVLELQRREECESHLIVTGQHREMLDQMLSLFRLSPDADLAVMSERQTLTQVTTRVLEGMEREFAEAKPDVVLVHGDTTTSFAGALAAYYSRIPIGHVEAGLRTGDKYNPFPEEMNRGLIDVLADVLFAPTPAARETLLKENVSSEKIYVTGNTVIDALLEIAGRPAPPDLLPDVPPDAPVVLVEAHRRENFGDPMRQICLGLRDLVESSPGAHIVFSVHMNPNVREPVYEILGGVPRVHLLPPLDYVPFVFLMKRARVILTDSGGIQEEAPSLKTPVLVLRTVTERPEAVAARTALVIGPDRKKIRETAARLISDEVFHAEMTSSRNPYGDGRAAARTVDALLHYFNVGGARPVDFAT